MSELEHSADPVAWLVARCPVSTGVHEDEVKLVMLLAQGWEPFAATASSAGHYVYHFRRPAHSNGADNG